MQCLAQLSAGAVQAGHLITINRVKFGQPPVPLMVGDVIVWCNQDLFRHTATARDGTFDLDLPSATEARLPLMAAGKIEVFCRFHPGMKLV
ncbi:MAG: hypothetical protein ORN49_09130, partial [Rhodobacteraceae bacterium]|nr:hypothetical protein [Paracoccaceae bacterium]